MRVTGASKAARSTAASFLAVASAGAAAFAWAALIERRMFTLRRVTVPVLAAGAKPITMLHISDLHMAPWQAKKQRWVLALADLKPDLVVNTGDNLGHERAIPSVAAALAPLAGTPGVYVWGSNDSMGPQLKNPLKYLLGNSSSWGHARPPANLDLSALGREFDGLGWVSLNNAAVAFDLNGTRLEFFGVDDPHHSFDRLDLVPGALEALEEDESDDELPTVRVGLTHAPYQRVLDSFLNNGADLIFAGHTHGGQVCVPGFGALTTNCDIPREQVKGLSLWSRARRAAWLHVSAGLGTSIYAPVRFACRPEATLLTLTGP